MKLTLERDALHAAFGRVAKVIESRNTIPILGHICLRAEGDRLAIVGTDLDLEMSESVPAKVATPGATTVPARVIADIISRSASGAEVSLEQASPFAPLVVRIARSRITLQTFPAEDFPSIDCGAIDCSFEIEASAFSKLLAKTEFAICRDETRYYLGGIYLHCAVVNNEARLRAVATDGHRLARHDIPAPAGAQIMRAIILPRKTVGEIIRLGKDGGGPALVELNSGKIRVTFADRTVLVSKLVDGTFPDYERITPQSTGKNTLVDREALLDALSRVSAVARGPDGDSSVKIALRAGQIEVSTRHPATGDAVEELEADYDGPDFEIGFSPKYLRDTVGTLESDQIRGGFDDPGSPAVFEEKGRDGLFLILMPKRI